MMPSFFAICLPSFQILVDTRSYWLWMQHANIRRSTNLAVDDGATSTCGYAFLYCSSVETGCSQSSPRVFRATMTQGVRARHQRVPAKSAPPRDERTSLQGQSRLRRLLWLLAFTTVLLILHQAWRLNTKRASALDVLRGKLKDTASVPARTASHVAPGVTPAAAPATDDSTPGTVPGSRDVPADMLQVQFDDDGEMDLGTFQRMLDILYKRPVDPEGLEPMDSDATEYRFRRPADAENGRKESPRAAQTSAELSQTIAGYL